MQVTLRPDTVALRVTSAPTTRPDLPFGRCSLWFTREPRIVLVADVGEKVARTLCDEMQLTTEQLTAAELAAIAGPPVVVAEAQDSTLSADLADRRPAATTAREKRQRKRGA